MIKFQVLEWDEYKDENANGEEEYGLRLFGRSEDEKTIAVSVKNFKPFFFIKLDRKYNNIQQSQLIQEVKKNVWPKELHSGLVKYRIEEHCDFYHFSNFTKFHFIRFEFSSLSSYKAYERVFKKKLFIPYVSRQKLKFKVYESNIIPYLRLLHIKDLRSVGWIQIDSYDIIKESFKKTYSEIEVETDFMNLTPLNDIIKCQKFTILSFDLECTSGDRISFPNPEKPSDKVIQIGLTMSRYGEDECYSKYILTLGGCTELEGITVHSYETEEDLLLGFQRLIIELDSDFITGYNIFGFDFKYLYLRAKLLGIEHKFARLSRIKNHICEFVETKLASSALGENILKYYKMPGRVVFDLMKVVQRDYKLGSYKLDAVAENFIRQELTNISPVNGETNQTMIDTKNTNGINIGQFIKICWDDGMTENSYLESKKFRIIELKKNQIIVEGTINSSEFMGKGYKVMWAQAKDDISPQQLFELQEKEDKDRAIIARYCVQDCALCNKLIAKLQIITNSIGMAMVCHVPISFLFLRGQGVKIYSLVAKKCRECDHLIPVLKKKIKIDPADLDKNESKLNKLTHYFNNKNKDDDVDDDDDDDDDGYEGATVFEPKTGVHLDPIPVLDFSSLYPNSMRLRNLSHEMLVTNTSFMNLPGYIYHKISHKKPDGRFVECIFAEKDNGTKGIIPDILSELLSARKKYKNQMEDLKENGGDPFIVAILDGLQQAYKVTANSLYGQTGAPTSPIYMKEIAASTTATGREMLQFSKYFIENIFATMINLSKTSKKKFLEYAESIYKYFPTKLQLDEETEFHIETIENKQIHDGKFIRKTIEFYVKKYEDMLKKYSKELESINIKTEQDYEKFINKLTLNSYQNIREFRKKLKYLFDIEFDNNDLEYDDKIKEILNITKKDFFKIDRSIYTKDFVEDFNCILDNIGYKNRTEMFLKFYDIVQDTLMEYIVEPQGIYGDTDSIFYCLYLKDKDGKPVQNKEALKISIKFGIWSSILISTLLPAPMAQEYEKVLYPFIILTKKRYVGNLYEKSPDKFKQKSMGIVLKRRDNANIVKIICGNIIDQILNKRSPKGAVDKTQEILDLTIKGKIPLDKFIITKTLKTTYKNRESIVHAVLADRMAKRDQGNKPQSNDRIPYAYIELPPEATINLQGDRVEHWDYIQEKKLKLDYLFYITNQIMKPATQFLELIVDEPEKIFNEYIIKEENRKNGKMPINYYFQGTNNIPFDEFAEILDDTGKKNSNKFPIKVDNKKIVNNKKILNNKKIVNNKKILNNEKPNINDIKFDFTDFI